MKTSRILTILHECVHVVGPHVVPYSVHPSSFHKGKARDNESQHDWSLDPLVNGDFGCKKAGTREYQNEDERKESEDLLSLGIWDQCEHGDYGSEVTKRPCGVRGSEICTGTY